jgi:hypothetical protein
MSNIFALATRTQRSTFVRHTSVSDTFDDLVNVIFADDLAHYWKFQNVVASTVDDEQGLADATVAGTVELHVPTIVRGDTIAEGAGVDGEVIAWPGTVAEYAEAPHHAAQKTPAGTIIVYAQFDSLSKKSQLIMGDASAAAGGFAMGVNTNGQPDAYLRGTDAVLVPVAGQAGDVQPNHAYCFMFKWGSGGLELVVYNDVGALVRRIVNTGMLASVSGTSTIRFGATHGTTPANQHDGPYGRVVWLHRSISAPEELLFAARTKTIVRVGSYRDIELAMLPFALWGLGDAGGIVEDVVGTRDGTYAGTVTRRVADLPGLIADGGVNFGGTGSATIPYDVGMQLPAWTLSCWLKVNGVPPGGGRWALVARDEGGITADDFAIILEDDSTLTIGFQDPVDRIILTPPAVTPGVVYHLAVRADATGFDGYLNGVYLGKNTNFTLGWSTNNLPLRFATVPWRAELANFVLDEVALFSRVLTQTEIYALAQRQAISPVTRADAVNVPESVPTAIPVLGNDDYVGAPTIEVVDSDGGRAVAAGTVVNYTAPTVTGNEARSFTYRIIDANGTSNTSTVSVTVVDSGTPAPAIANCYPATGLTNVPLNPATMAQLQARVNAADPGDHILIPAGTYAGGILTFTPAGTAANPIVIRPQDARGSVTITNAAWTVNGNRLVIAGLYFTGSRIAINGNNNRVTRCRFRNVNQKCVDVMRANQTRIDHCDISDWPDTAIEKGFVGTNAGPDFFQAGNYKGVLVDYNYMHDISHPNFGPNASCFVHTDSNANGWRQDSQIVIDHNLLMDCNPMPDPEFITCKHSGITISYNTFVNVDTYLQQRQGGGWEIRSNWFEAMPNAAPLKCFDDFGAGTQSGAGRALVIGNRLQGALTMWVGCGNSANVGPNFYHASREARYIGNIVGGTLRVGETYGGQQPPEGPTPVNATNNNLWNNTVQGVVRNAFAGGLIAKYQAGTTFQQDNEPYTPAVKLAPGDVGMGAPDPLCPTGPQG